MEIQVPKLTASAPPSHTHAAIDHLRVPLPVAISFVAPVCPPAFSSLSFMALLDQSGHF